MNQSRAVRGAQRTQDLSGQSQGLAYRQGTGRHEIAQIRSLDVFHDQVGDALETALVVNRDHSRIRQARRGAGLSSESGDEVGGVGQVGMHELEPDDAVEPAIVCPVDGCHSATRHKVDDLVARVDQATGEGILDHNQILRRRSDTVDRLAGRLRVK